MKKRIIGLLMTAVMCISLAACGSAKEEAAFIDSSSGSAQATPAVEETTPEAPDPAESDEDIEQEDPAVTETPATPAAPPASLENGEYGIGDTWTVDGLWSLTILGVTKSGERSEYYDENPEAVYIIDYVYTNEGYDDSVMDLYLYLSNEVYDSAGQEGYDYYATQERYPTECPVGATCIAQDTIGLDHDGTFKIVMNEYGEDYTEYSATFVIDPNAAPVDMDIPTSSVPETTDTLGIGEAWTVDGQWELTIDSVTKTEDRSDYNDIQPSVLYYITYTYKNLGYVDESGIMDGLYIGLDRVTDSKGILGDEYLNEKDTYPEEVPVGESCTVTTCFGFENEGPLTIYLSEYDGSDDYNLYQQAFRVDG